MQDDDRHVAIVRDVLAAASLPQPTCMERAREGIGNHVYFADDVVVRLGTGSDAAKFPRAVAVMRAAAATVAVPEIIFEDCSCADFPVPVMVLARVPGHTLSQVWPTLKEDDRLELVSAVASQLSRVHRIDPNEVPDAGFSSPWWSDRVSRIERLLVELRPRPRFPDAWFESMARYVADHRDALTTAPPPAVLHNDVNWGNVLVVDDGVSALLDFDDALAGPPEEDWWQLVFRCVEADPPMAPERLRDLPEFDLSAPGTLERFKIGEIESALDLLTGELSWIDPDIAVTEARETYEEAFATDRYERLLDRLL